MDINNNINNTYPAAQQQKDSKTKKTVAIILIIVIILLSCAIGFAVYINKNNDEKEKAALRKAVEEYTTKQLLEFYYDDYDANGKNEAFAIAGDGDKDEFRKADIIYVDRQKKPKTVDSDIDGHTNGIIKGNKTKFVSVEKEAEKPEDNRSFIYGVKEEDTYQPGISGKYQNVRQKDKDIVAEDPETGEALVLTVDGDGELVTGGESGSSDNTGSEEASSDSTFTGSEATGTIITFGSYPQSKVTDSATLSKLDAADKNWQSYNYYSGIGTWADGQMKTSDYMKYADVALSGKKYRAVTFSEYRPYSTGGKSSAENSYQDDNGYDTGEVYYFEYEPLQWRVLDASEGLILSEKAIDSQAYNNYIIGANGEYWGDAGKTHYASDWEHSSIREWLNSDFYNTAFSASQQSKIKKTHLKNESTYDSRYNGADTDDSVFLLSYNDVLDTSYGFDSSADEDDTARQLKSTDYAQSQGCETRTKDGGSGDSCWWLRSPGKYSDCVAYIFNTGYADANGYGVGQNNYSVRPALKINPES